MDAGSPLERSPYLVLGRLVLMPDRSPGQNEAAQAAAPKGLRIGDGIGRRVLLDRDFDEPGLRQQALEFPRIGKPQHIVALRYVGRQGYAKLGDGFAKDPLYSLPGRIIPPGKRHASARFESANTFGDGGF